MIFIRNERLIGESETIRLIGCRKESESIKNRSKPLKNGIKTVQNAQKTP